MISNCPKCDGPGKLRVGFLGECKGVWCPRCGEMTDSNAEWEARARAVRRVLAATQRHVGAVVPEADGDEPTWGGGGNTPAPPAPVVGSVVKYYASDALGVVSKSAAHAGVFYVNGIHADAGRNWAYSSLPALCRAWFLAWVVDGGRYRLITGSGFREVIADVVPGVDRNADIKFLDSKTGALLGRHTNHDSALSTWEPVP